MAGLFQVAMVTPSPANAILLDIDKEKGLGLLINAVFNLCIVGVILVGHTSKLLRELLVKYGKSCWKFCEPVTGWPWKKLRKPSLDANRKTMSAFRDVTFPLSSNRTYVIRPVCSNPPALVQVSHQLNDPVEFPTGNGELAIFESPRYDCFQLGLCFLPTLPKWLPICEPNEADSLVVLLGLSSSYMYGLYHTTPFICLVFISTNPKDDTSSVMSIEDEARWSIRTSEAPTWNFYWILFYSEQGKELANRCEAGLWLHWRQMKWQKCKLT